ncbi:TolC family protein [Methylobacterium sp. WSM2598]|uniref:TolC family protein n=1 Tax=Methylobacterium sp. WSM2598 TaxID=398261 RepID=UPI0003649BFF|nr:TolC family protein [Methylobacterium sp. WSM2598]
MSRRPIPFERCAVLALAAALVGGTAGPGAAQSLDAAGAAALDQSPALKADRARQEGAEARRRGALDAFMPSISFSADRPLDSKYSYSPNAAPTQIGIDSTPRSAPTQLGLKLDLPLFDGFKRWHTLESTTGLAEAGRFVSQGKRQQVLLDTGVAYLAVLRDARSLAYRDAQVAAVARIRQQAERQFEVRDATQTDVALARSREDAAQAQGDRARADLAASRLEFRRLTGMEPERMAQPRLPANLPASADAYAALVQRANPNLAASRLDAGAARAQARAARAELLPQVNLQFSRSAVLNYSQALDQINDTTTRLVAKLPLYEPGAYPRIEEASALALQRAYESQDLELTTLTAARTLHARRRAIGEQAERLLERVRRLRETVRSFSVERRAGFRTVLDELNLRAELADAEVAAAAVVTERDALTLQLAAAAGLLGLNGPGLRRLDTLPPPLPPGPVALPPALAGGEPEGPPFLRGSLDAAGLGEGPGRVSVAAAGAGPRPW